MALLSAYEYRMLVLVTLRLARVLLQAPDADQLADRARRAATPPAGRSAARAEPAREARPRARVSSGWRVGLACRWSCTGTTRMIRWCARPHFWFCGLEGGAVEVVAVVDFPRTDDACAHRQGATHFFD